jgi:NAD(P)-dependent dehydrogenase (short-subunit alcohol dehydrogenase family)
MTNEYDYKDRVAIVTGGGYGIGREVAQSLAHMGARVAIVGRSQSRLDETLGAIEAAGGKATVHSADVADEAAVRRIVSDTEARFGPVDILISNAGLDGPFGPLWLNDTAAWRRTLDTNLFGSVVVAKSVLPGMVERRKGHIVFVGSGGGLWPVPYDTGYAVTKAGLIRLCETLALEAEEFNVRCFCIHPGVVHTGMSDSVMNSPDGQKWLPKYDVALERGKTPIEWASQLCNFLVSGEADGLSGCFLSVNDDYREMASRAKQIQEQDLYKLRLNLTPGRAPPRPFQ